MQPLAVLAVLASLALAHANIGFYFFQGFQTKNTSDTFYVSISATSDRGYTTTATSPAMKFYTKNNFTLTNADKYVTNLMVTLYQSGSNSALATISTAHNQKLLSYNFYVVAHTASYDVMTGANTPKLSYGVGGDNSTTVAVVAGNYYYPSTSSEVAKYTPPPVYYGYTYPFGDRYGNIETTTSQLRVGETVRYSTSCSSSYIYLSSAKTNTVDYHSWCSGSKCTTYTFPSYAGSGQTLFVVYYGNYMFNNQIGMVGYATPPNTLEIM